MAFITITNVKIDGIASCVPQNIHQVKECECLTAEDAEKLSAVTGIFERRLVNEIICTSDLCFAAAKKLLESLQWDENSIDALFFVTQTPDYVLPATSPILASRLGLNKNCFTLDISLGCSGYVYGLTTLATLVSTGSIKRALLLVGDTISKICSKTDKSTYPIFGDAGTATALSYDTQAKPIYGEFLSDGNGYESIIVKDGGYRNMISPDSIRLQNVADGIERSPNQLELNGMDVFSFGISKAPEVVKQLLARINIDIDAINYFVFHQANKMMNDKINKKLLITNAKSPSSLEKFGNTSCASIPLTISSQLAQQVSDRKQKLILCGFGVGLSWGAVYLETEPLCCPPLIEI